MRKSWNMTHALFKYLLLSLGWCAAGWWYQTHSLEAPPWFLIMGALFFGIPIFLSGFYGAIVGKIESGKSFKSRGLLYWWTMRRAGSLIKWLLIATTLGVSTAIWFAGIRQAEWISIALVVVSFYMCFLLLLRFTQSEYKTFMATYRAIILARWMATVISISVYFFIFPSALENGMSISGRLAELGTVEASESGSLLLQLGVYFMKYVQIFRESALAALLDGHGLLWKAAGVTLVTAGIFWGISATLSCFVIPRSELRRIFSSAEIDGEPAPLSGSTVIFVSAFATLIVAFIFPATVLSVESFARSKITLLENCEGTIALPGTCRKLEEHDFSLLTNRSEQNAQLVKQIRRGFEQVRLNVGGYLDHYYSLPAEYLRLAAMLTGNLEDALEKDVKGYLEKGEPFKKMEGSLAVLSKELDIHTEERAAILAKNTSREQPLFFRIKEFESASTNIHFDEQLNLQSRIGAGAVGGIVAAAISKKLVAKGTLKIATIAMTKVAAAKTGSALAGAATGAVIGSFFPVIGTFFGSAVGGVVGLAIGVSVDGLMLIVEEELGREDFHRDILRSINEQEAAMISLLSTQS
jgi:hypothetical protein